MGANCPPPLPSAFLIPLLIMPQAVSVCKPPHERVEEQAQAAAIRRKLALAEGEVLLLLAAGLRPVKDVLYVLDAFVSWHHAAAQHVQLRIVGPSLDSEYAAAVEKQLAPGHVAACVRYCGALPRQELHCAMRAARAVLNTSVSEGMCNSLLESMLIGTPVLARRNCGNEALLSDGRTALLFSTPSQMVACARRLLDEPALGGTLAAAAVAQVGSAHSEP